MAWFRLIAGLFILGWALLPLPGSVPKARLGRAATPPKLEQYCSDGSARPISTADPLISDVLVTNRRDVAFTVTWRTDAASTGRIEFGETPSLGQVAYDDRGEDVASRVHHVTLTRLTPDTTYYYRVHAGGAISPAEGEPYQATTLPTGVPPVPFLAYGQVKTSGGDPAEGALVRVRLLDAGGGQSEPLSKLVDSYGYWSLNLPLASCSGVQLQLAAFGAEGGVAELTHAACDLRPAPAMVLVDGYEVAVTVVGQGRVEHRPGNPYQAGQKARLEPIADPGWAFAGWSGPDAGDLEDQGDGTWSLTVDDDKAVTATFAEGLYEVTVTVVGQGRVEHRPGNPYRAGQEATLEPIPDPGWAFAEWSGPDAGELEDNGDGTWSLPVDGDKAVTAIFGRDEYSFDIYLPLIGREDQR